MRRSGKMGIAAVTVVLAFAFFVPVVQVGFVTNRSQPVSCTSTPTRPAAGGSDVCGYYYWSYRGPGYGSVTYWLSGVGAVYDTNATSGYGIAW